MIRLAINWRFFSITAIIFVSLFTFFQAVPAADGNGNATGEKAVAAGERNCADRRVAIFRAAERYMLDNNVSVPPEIERLVHEEFLGPGSAKCPSGGKYAIGREESPDGIITVLCSIHRPFSDICADRMTDISLALEIYLNNPENPRTAVSPMDLTKKRYLARELKCPAAGGASYCIVIAMGQKPITDVQCPVHGSLPARKGISAGGPAEQDNRSGRENGK